MKSIKTFKDLEDIIGEIDKGEFDNYIIQIKAKDSLTFNFDDYKNKKDEGEKHENIIRIFDMLLERIRLCEEEDKCKAYSRIAKNLTYGLSYKTVNIDLYKKYIDKFINITLDKSGNKRKMIANIADNFIMFMLPSRRVFPIKKKGKEEEIREIKKQINLYEDANYEFLTKIEKLVKSYDDGSGRSYYNSVEKLKPSIAKSLYILWYIIDSNCPQVNRFANNYSRLIESGWPERYHDDGSELYKDLYNDLYGCDDYREENIGTEFKDFFEGKYSKNKKEVDSKSDKNNDTVLSPYGPEIVNKHKMNNHDTFKIDEDGTPDLDNAFELIVDEMRATLISLAKLVFTNDKTVNSLINDVSSAEVEDISEVIEKYFDKYKTEYRKDEYFQMLARFCNFFPSRSLNGLSPIEAIYFVNKKKRE